jgi:LemA protein
MLPGLIVLVIVIGIPLLFIIWVMVMFNSLVRLRNLCDESWSNIDTELKRRYDLIPNLVNTVKGYATHEKELFDRVLQSRNAALANTGSPTSQAKDENILMGNMRQLFALAENYPDLKASQNFMELQKELANTEDRIQRSRRFYNANVRELNTRIEVVPTNIIAGWFNFQKRELFEVENPEVVREVPAVKF